MRTYRKEFPIFLGVRLSADDKAKLVRLVAQHGTDQSAMVRKLLRAAALDDDGAEAEEVTAS
jgi:hypothetical protein